MITSSSSRPFHVAGIAVLSLLLAACGASAKEAKQIAELLCLQGGAHVADVGAGDGEWTVKLAREVGEGGHVYATEVKEDLVEDIRKRAKKAKLDNVTVLLGDDEDTGLPEDCCDAILLRLVDHHFTDPAPMRASLKKALRPDGILAIIDIVPQTSWRDLPGVPDRGGHGIPVDALVEEMTADGFEVLSRYDEWNDDDERFCVVFRR